MIINLINNDYKFDISNTAILFYPRISVVDDSDGKKLTVSLDGNTAYAEYNDSGILYRSVSEVDDSLYDGPRCACVRVAFDVFHQATGLRPPWGLLIGVRPVNFYLKMSDVHGDSCEEVLEKSYLVASEKINICRKAVEMRKSSVDKLSEDSYSLYISIPFCPSRCKYCSFVSYSTEKEKKYIAPYIETLCNEIKKTAETAPHRKPLTVYIGGGTPTCIEDCLFEKVLNQIRESFDLSDCFEYTVEAGRPETITEEKLCIMKKYGVNRVSVNPQTLSEEVLFTAGRKHTVQDFFKAYSLAKEYGFDINIDLIAGLPLETTESFENGLKKIIELSPANITVHTLYIKRAADYGLDSSLYANTDPEAVTQMVSTACNLLEKEGYFPYYLYRQKNTVGNNENIGFSKKGKECAYNIYMMDDIQTVYACGANAMTKIVKNGSIDRSCGTKFAYNYIRNNGEKNK